MGLDIAHDSVNVLDTIDASTTFTSSRPIDKLDVTVYTADVIAEFEDPRNGWGPPAGVLLRAGIFQSITGVGGAIAVRFHRAALGVAATLDFRAFSQ